MLPRQFRLSKTRDVLLVLRRGRGFFSSFLKIKHLSKPENIAPRATVVVSTKVDKRAVGRNRIKRVVRESFRKHFKKLPRGDWVIHAQPPAARLNKKELREEADKLIGKILAGNPISGLSAQRYPPKNHANASKK